MSTLGPKKKNLLIILGGIIAGALIISVVLDILMNNGGRVILVGAIAGIVIAAIVFLVLNIMSKKSSSGDYDEFAEEGRFTRSRRNKERSDNLFDAAGFEEGDSLQDEGGFADFDDELVIEPEQQPVIPNRFAKLPSEQLREKGFFGRQSTEPEESFEPEENEENTVWDEPEYDDSFDTGFENEGYSDMEFDAPVIAFGDPVPNEDVFAEELPAENDEEVIEFEAEISEESEFEEVQYEEPETETQPEIIVQPEPVPEAKNELLLKDIAPGMVVASQAPGQTLESFYADMSEEDIIYRDCVEVWSSAAKNPMMKILEKLKNIEDKKVAGELGRDCEYVNAMIDRMLYFTQLEMIDQALNMQVYNYSVLVKECLKRFSPFFTEKKISLLWKGLDVNVITDKRWFIFAMTQVIFNSIEFTPHGGKIAVSAKKTDDYVDLIIDDNGEGMDEEELPYAFTAGFMGDEAPNPDDTRTGMGLFITRSVLQKLGGECMAESTKGKGMRIVIRLPAMKEETEN